MLKLSPLHIVFAAALEVKVCPTPFKERSINPKII
jgi:hypothetical protein